MALPRRPYLLGLFPGTSNDWAPDGSTERQRESRREVGKRKVEVKEKETRWDHMRSTDNLNSKVSRKEELRQRPDRQDIKDWGTREAHRRRRECHWGRRRAEFLPRGQQACVRTGDKRGHRVLTGSKESLLASFFFVVAFLGVMSSRCGLHLVQILNTVSSRNPKTQYETPTAGRCAPSRGRKAPRIHCGLHVRSSTERQRKRGGGRKPRGAGGRESG